MNLVLHPRTKLQLSALKSSPAGSVIFHGPQGIGKHAAARELARELNCLGDEGGACANCRRLGAGNFTDLMTISREDKASIAVDQIRKLTADISLRPAQTTTHRVVIIEDAQSLTLEAQNALLKLLEEPPPSTLIALLTDRFDGLIPTIRSRCQQISFIPPGQQALAGYLREEAHLDEAGAQRLAVTTDGLPGIAMSLRNDPDAAQAVMQMDEMVASVLDKSVFERLLLAGKLASAGGDITRFSLTLQRQIANRLTSGKIDGPSAAKLLGALEVFRRQIAAKVNQRVALERLMLEIG